MSCKNYKIEKEKEEEGEHRRQQNQNPFSTPKNKC